MKLDSLWSSVLTEMELSLSPGNFTTWVSPLSAGGIKKLNNDRVIFKINCPSIFHKNQVGERYVGQIQAVAEKALGKKCEVELEVKQARDSLVIKKVSQESSDLFSVDTKQVAKEAYETAAMKAGLNLRLTFENYAVSSSNEVAHAAAKTAAKKPGLVYHLVFIYGGVGVGKTHLMQATGHKIVEKNPDTALVYCSGE